MTCKNCGADISIQDRKCPYCRSIIDYIYPADNEKGYYDPFEDRNYYNNTPYHSFYQDPDMAVRQRADSEAQKAILCALLGFIIGFFILRIVLAIVSLRCAANAKKAYRSINEYPGGRITAAIIISVISLAIAFITLIFFLIVFSSASLSSSITYSIN